MRLIVVAVSRLGRIWRPPNAFPNQRVEESNKCSLSSILCSHPLRFTFRLGFQSLLKRFFADHYINQIGSRIIEHMVVYDYAYMAWTRDRIRVYGQVSAATGVNA